MIKAVDTNSRIGYKLCCPFYLVMHGVTNVYFTNQLVDAGGTSQGDGASSEAAAHDADYTQARHIHLNGDDSVYSWFGDFEQVTQRLTSLVNELPTSI